ncbi:MAG: hypothetical protein UV43_C0021G0006 [Parcubacteria group bacterium GW2011_GWF2_42_7]|nr:MAG: hypothetical protein UU66_C0005G0010 [Parcubacteria group bacterium GW2011_GWB1_41_5]KKS72152.1 MAG: hypothetical protein UV43_C0021G0006 [Parcubacteria group bacterium GW2011_GWF2_42_7]OGI78723.1 MAG: hypothetical protein A3C65_02025 [Candidatus Nomurabacteria bacterium RIFCSPHIGHO2_02_FULL_41_150]
MFVENKTCQNCKKKFEIEQEDLNFYEKIKVPAPSFCPDCRAQRRFIWRNERNLYKRPCDLCKKDFIFIYDKDTPFPVYCRECYLSDKWDPKSFGFKYDRSAPFFTQIKKLLDTVPRMGIWTVGCKNSEYTNQSYFNKNAYLSFALRDCEDVAYLQYAKNCRQTLDSSYVLDSEQCYETINAGKNYNSSYLQECVGMVDSNYAFACRNCENVFGVVNLRSGKNIFFGEQLSKEAYLAKIDNLKLDQRSVRDKIDKKFNEIKSKSIVKNTEQIKCVNCVGDHLENSKDCYYVFDGWDLEKARYSSWVFGSKDISDCFGMGGSELIYEAISPEDIRNCKFVFLTDSSHDCEYTAFCQSSSNLFGCVGVRSGEYMILNRAYSKEEYQNLTEQIKKDMSDLPYVDAREIIYKYGEFFPNELCSTSYNESIAGKYYPLTDKEARGLGFKWKKDIHRSYTPTLIPVNVPNSINDVPDTITNEIIACFDNGKCRHQCTTAFRITKEELIFYKKHSIPLPILCPNCRHGKRMESRNPQKLWNRNCAKCGKEIMSSYSPDRPETVYCETCYQREVY